MAAFLPKDGQSLIDLLKLPEGAGEQVLSNVVVDGEPPVAVMPGSGFASRVVRVLRGQRCGVGDRKAVHIVTFHNEHGAWGNTKEFDDPSTRKL